MRKLLTIFLSAALCSCAAIPTVLSLASGISTSANKVSLDGTIALTLAADAYTGANIIVTAAVERGAFNHDQLVKIENLNDQGLALLQSGASGLTQAQRAAKLMTIVSQLHSIRGK